MTRVLERGNGMDFKNEGGFRRNIKPLQNESRHDLSPFPSWVSFPFDDLEKVSQMDSFEV